MRYFILTVDTEGDNLWKWHPGADVTTENSRYVPRFQTLCEQYGIKPVYLTNYEMVLNREFAKFLKEKQKCGLCEIGMHIHAWNNPPEYQLENRYGGNAYITEYPNEVMESKAIFLKDLLENTFEVSVLSHRSGRWATNESYLKILQKIGINIDCSFTPQLDLSKIPGCSANCGNDYTKVPVGISHPVEGLLEIPMTTRKMRCVDNGTWKHKLKTLLLGEAKWFRLLGKSFDKLIKLEQNIRDEGTSNYIEMMIHFSELMAGGSPYFKTEEDIEYEYILLEKVFCYMSQKGYTPITLRSYAEIIG